MNADAAHIIEKLVPLLNRRRGGDLQQWRFDGIHGKLLEKLKS